MSNREEFRHKTELTEKAFGEEYNTDDVNAVIEHWYKVADKVYDIWEDETACAYCEAMLQARALEGAKYNLMIKEIDKRNEED